MMRTFPGSNEIDGPTVIRIGRSFATTTAPVPNSAAADANTTILLHANAISPVLASPRGDCARNIPYEGRRVSEPRMPSDDSRRTDVTRRAGRVRPGSERGSPIELRHSILLLRVACLDRPPD